jgi:hypothetical protein
MDQIYIKTPNPSSLVFTRVYRLEIQLVILVFSTPLVNYRLSNLLFGSPTPPPFPLPCVNKYRECIHTVRNTGGGR